MKLFRNKPTLSPQMRIRLGLLLGCVLGGSVSIFAIEHSGGALANAPLEFRVAFYIFFFVVSFVALMRRRTPDKSALKPRWWKT